MTNNVVPYNWLPPLIPFTGDWAEYETILYQSFCDDFLTRHSTFSGKRLVCKKHPEIKGKSATFWHMISDGKVEQTRLPDIRRCERIKWPRPTIEHAPELKIWRNTRNISGGVKERICIAFDNWEYLVVLEERDTYILFWTAYPILENHQKRKLQREYVACLNKQEAPQ